MQGPLFSVDPKGDYVGLNVSPFMGWHAGSHRFPCTVLLFFGDPGEDVEGNI